MYSDWAPLWGSKRHLLSQKYTYSKIKPEVFKKEEWILKMKSISHYTGIEIDFYYFSCSFPGFQIFCNNLELLLLWSKIEFCEYVLLYLRNEISSLNVSQYKSLCKKGRVILLAIIETKTRPQGSQLRTIKSSGGSPSLWYLFWSVTHFLVPLDKQFLTKPFLRDTF